ncbi:TPA: carboxypeptidase [Bacillus cereus]|nr:carboxypeptidase [Bacillus cereus]HDR4799102.1 carboxypeptidase [Bacillus cereus]HDR4805167.1 carboxypeptidase [Bacillus cereus]HDR4811194.1 carboxypeptidase [Bacillus cereus]HDR4833617.1 carboxypeptidase [Bacillus cereus]
MKLYSVRIHSNSHEELKRLEKFDFDLQYRISKKTDVDYYEVPGILTNEQIEKVKQSGYQVEIIEDLNKVAEERKLEVSSVNRFNITNIALEEMDDTVLGGYMTADEVETALIRLSEQFPNLITLIELPNQTWEGRISRAVRLRAGTNSNRTGVLFTGSMHAREWGGSDICINFLRRLITSFQSNTQLTFGGKIYTSSEIRNFMEELDIFVFPDVNPDGKHYSQTTDPNSGTESNMWWRKNRNPNIATGGTHLGVDINRNFDYLWSSGIGTSSNPPSFIYKGTGPFSEPETRNVRYLFDTYPNIRYYIDIHSYGGLILYPWGDDENQGTDPNQNFRNSSFDQDRGKIGDMTYKEYMPVLDQNTLLNLANRMYDALHSVRGVSYTVMQSAKLYEPSGTSATSIDYAYSRHIVDSGKSKIYAFTVEFGREFVPPYQEMLHIIDDVNAAMTEFCHAIK